MHEKLALQMAGTGPSTQTHTHAPDMFDGSNPEDLWAFLLQCQITFNAHPQNFTSESAKVFFAISYIRKQCLELLEAQGAMRVSRAYREVIVSARARCH